MKATTLQTLILTVMMCADATAQSVIGQLKDINAEANTFSVNGTKGEVHMFRTKTTTEVWVTGKRATLKDLPAGASVQVTRGETNYAARIISPAPGAQTKAAPSQANMKVPATATKLNPVLIGGVVAGQRVTVTAKKVWWSGGGSRKGSYCDWKGYDQTNVNGLPWMALVAAVGNEDHGVKDNSLAFEVKADGTLTLFANDSAPDGNDGDAQVTVTVSPK